MTHCDSHLLKGWVRHRRYTPKPHRFRYPVFMSWIDLDQLSSVVKTSPWWSCERFNLVSFYRRDFLAPIKDDLKTAVRKKIQQQTGTEFFGKVCLLTNLRYLGFSFNPVSFYFCYPEEAKYPRFIIAEINNTPWDERFCYVLDTQSCPGKKGKWTFKFAKAFHVSPFMPMNLLYQWHFCLQQENVTIHMRLKQEDKACFDATLQLKSVAMDRKNMWRVPIHYPFITLTTLGRIYWQALRLWLKRIPVFDHPAGLNKFVEEKKT